MGDVTCREFIDFLDQYTDGSLDQEVRAKFEQHMAVCPYCVDYLKTYSDTIQIARAACAEDASAPPPAEAPEELIQAIISAAKKRSPTDTGE